MDNNLVPKGEVGAMVKIVVGSQRMSTEHKVRELNLSSESSIVQNEHG